MVNEAGDYGGDSNVNDRGSNVVFMLLTALYSGIHAPLRCSNNCFVVYFYRLFKRNNNLQTWHATWTIEIKDSIP
ncbi:hypothetical protein VII00023_21547 [Vibrio ichthyoenteri ATCC 700023]|uniref:Uncharacterized protein n=1 Tax=Vibrio ichthyoenteri ATCC 700023 TaxID=870968 RepID=F9S5U4_9VIBR|nr:hypothetical protein VII00023_21547 [Vibrio ichthyoenteri ATCC 700023]